MKTFFSFKTFVLAIVATSIFTATQAEARDRHSHHHHYDHRHPQYRPTRSTSYERANFYASVQYELARRGYYQGRIDGVMGAVAQRAVRSFQRDHGLAVTGNVNTDVLRKLGLR